MAGRHKNTGQRLIEGKPVRDATRGLPLKITPVDCERGGVKDPGSCAAAQALLRIPGVQAARVQVSRTYVQRNGEWKRYMTPESLSREIIAFDRGGRKSFEPGEYYLRAPSPEEKLSAHRKRHQNDKRKNKPTGTREVHIHHTSNIRTRSEMRKAR